MDTSLRTPPRFVPTLTNVVVLPAVEQDHLFKAIDKQAEVERLHIAENDTFKLQEKLLHRVLQRIDMSLEHRLCDALFTAVGQHVDAMMPRLRHEIEDALRSLVTDALTQELSANVGSVPTQTEQSLG